MSYAADELLTTASETNVVLCVGRSNLGENKTKDTGAGREVKWWCPGTDPVVVVLKEQRLEVWIGTEAEKRPFLYRDSWNHGTCKRTHYRHL